jgi:hypothetical protein
MKIRPVEAEFFNADGRTDTTKLVAAFRSYSSAPKIIYMRRTDKTLQCAISRVLVKPFHLRWAFRREVVYILQQIYV